MIVTPQGVYGLPQLLRVQGSAVYKVALPVSISNGCLVVYYCIAGSFGAQGQTQFRHPDALGALIGFFGFLLTFRLGHSYSRYYEAVSACYQMQAKFLDCGMELAAFHYQSKPFLTCKPVTFAEDQATGHHNVDGRHERRSSVVLNPSRRRHRRLSLGIRRRQQAQGHFTPQQTPDDITYESVLSMDIKTLKMRTTKPSGVNLEDPSNSDAVKSHFPGQPHPTPFLQESAHLLSLLTAVAYASLRSDIEGVDLPIKPFVPGAPWPPLDSDKLSTESKSSYENKHRFGLYMRSFLGRGRTKRYLTLYHAARPLRVLGGVSDRELEMLGEARGPFGKLGLCTLWLQELISREYLSGSTGNVGAPIISNMYACISEGTDAHNQARKIGFTPFPFPHAQIASVFCFVIMFLLPVLYFNYVNKVWLAFVLNTATLACYLGMHEVALELEDPFKNEPNELPLTNWQAQYNEALLCMYAGYHPDYRSDHVPNLSTLSDGDESSTKSEKQVTA